MNFFTLKFEGNGLVILDQTRLPEAVEYLRLEDYRAAIEAIQTLRVRGAPAIGIAGAYAAVLAAQAARSGEELRQALAEIAAARPTAVNLRWAVGRIEQLVIANQNQPLEHIRKMLLEEALRMHAEDARMCEEIGRHGAALIHDGMRILTHCNAGALATGGIGTALGVIYTAARQGKRLRVHVDETRPLLQGARLTVWELQQEGIEVILNSDSMAAELMRRGEVDCVLTGADRVARNYDAANKIGTYGLAVLAHHHRLPFYVAIPQTTYDPHTPTGAEIVIEMRGPEEITQWGGRRIAPEQTQVFSPAFDVTPHALITAIITDAGVIRPQP